MDFIQGVSRNQLFMMQLDDYVAQDSWARVVDVFVNALPLQKLGFKNTLAKEGRPPFDAKDLLKLYLYGYKNGLRSSRKLEHACTVNIEIMWLLNGLMPSARAIAYFRKNNATAFKNAFRHFVGILKELNLIDGQTIAIDSFKIRAQNALKNNFNQKKIDRHIQYIDTKINEYQNQLDNEDNTELGQQIETKIEYQKSKKKAYQKIESKLKESEQAQISLTDTDARSVVLHRNIINVGYCVQAGCDAKYKLFINNDTGTVNDTNALSPMALDAKKLLQLDTMNVITDKGYTTAQHIQICTNNNITTFSSPKNHASQNNGLFAMNTFDYNQKEDSYICPNNKKLSTNGTTYKKRNHRVKHYKNRKACQHCALRNQCTKNKSGRIIERGIYQQALEENEKRVNQNPDYYRLRQQITEHQFGTIKRQWGFTHTLMRGKENVLSEVNLIMMCYNLKRIMSILTPQVVLQYFEKFVLKIIRYTSYFKTIYRPIFFKIKKHPSLYSYFKTPTYKLNLHY